MDLLAAYRTLLEISAQMAEAAEREEWETVSHLQAQRAAMISAEPARLPQLTAADAEALRALITQIQAHDATILDYAAPCREQIATLISRLAPPR